MPLLLRRQLRLVSWGLACPIRAVVHGDKWRVALYMAQQAYREQL